MIHGHALINWQIIGPCPNVRLLRYGSINSNSNGFPAALTGRVYRLNRNGIITGRGKRCFKGACIVCCDRLTYSVFINRNNVIRCFISPMIHGHTLVDCQCICIRPNIRCLQCRNIYCNTDRIPSAFAILIYCLNGNGITARRRKRRCKRTGIMCLSILPHAVFVYGD